jgi:hypothetical protein
LLWQTFQKCTLLVFVLSPINRKCIINK